MHAQQTHQQKLDHAKEVAAMKAELMRKQAEQATQKPTQENE